MSRIDAPRLDDLDITFFFQLEFDTPQLAQFISRTPQLNVRDKAHVAFSSSGAFFSIRRTYDRRLELKISCRQSDWQVLSMTQVCNSILSSFSALEHLYITKHVSSLRPWPGDIENSEWLELLQPFTAAKNLYLAKEYVPRILPALQELVGERVTEVLPALESLFLEEPHPSGPVQEVIEDLVTARQLSNHPIAISHWKRGVSDW